MAGLETYTQEDLDRLLKQLRSAQGEEQLMSWITDWVAAHLAVTHGSQIVGVPLLSFVEAPAIDTEQSTTSGSFTDLATRGPELTGMGDGNWILFWGCTIRESAGLDIVGQMSLLPSWAGESDSQVASTASPGNTRANAVYSRAFGTQGPAVVDATGFGNSSCRCRYRRQSGTGTPNFSNRWLVGVRTGPPTPGN